MDRIETLKKYLADNPDDSFLQHAMALEYVKLGDDANAKALFEKILARDPGYTGSYYHLAQLLVRTGDTNAAIAVYETGMNACKTAGDSHAYNELRAAYEDLIY